MPFVDPCSWYVGENWTAAKKPSDKRDTDKLPAGFSPPRNALSAVNGMLRRLMTLGELNLYNYSGGMPALYGSREVNGKECRVNGTALGKAEKGQWRSLQGCWHQQGSCAGAMPCYPAEPCLCMCGSSVLSQPYKSDRGSQAR